MGNRPPQTNQKQHKRITALIAFALIALYITTYILAIVVNWRTPHHTPLIETLQQNLAGLLPLLMLIVRYYFTHCHVPTMNRGANK